MTVPSSSWFAQMRMLDHANRLLAAQNAAYEAGEHWRITIAPQRRPNCDLVIVAHCICGYQSGHVHAGDDAFDVAWGYARQHLREAHDR